MVVYVARRLLVNVGVFLVISIGIFGLVHAAPGNAIEMQIGPTDFNSGTKAFIATREAQLGLTKPVPVQYLDWLFNAIRGHLGLSYVNNQPVVSLIAGRLLATSELMGLSLLLALVIAVPLGVFAAYRKNTLADYGTTVLSMLTISVPSFLLGIIAIYVLALRWQLLPTSGMNTPGVSSFTDSLRHLIMPVTILALAQTGPLLRYVRSGMLGELNQDYTRTAVAKGAGTTRVLFLHAFRNSLIPLVSVVMLTLPTLLAGAVVVETVFAWPGMGQLVIYSTQERDYPVIIGFAMISAALVLLCNLAADVLYSVVDPRVRLT